jgi:hypothetical protein
MFRFEILERQHDTIKKGTKVLPFVHTSANAFSSSCSTLFMLEETESVLWQKRLSAL